MAGWRDIFSWMMGWWNSGTIPEAETPIIFESWYSINRSTSWISLNKGTGWVAKNRPTEWEGV